MTYQTTGQRIAQCRKQLGLSQEALGEKLGVSRQAISKWEADAAMPDIDKLIALSRLFQVSVGWLLGVEELPHQENPQLTEEMLRSIEEIVRCYQPEKRSIPRWKKLVIGALALVLLLAGIGLRREWSYTRTQVAWLTGQLQSSDQQNRTILAQLNDLKKQMDSIHTAVKETSALLIEHSFILTPNYEESLVRVQITAVPKVWHDNWSATLQVHQEGKLILTQACHWDGSALRNSLDLPMEDDLQYWLMFSYPDGTLEKARLADEAAQNLKNRFTILYQGIPSIIETFKDMDPELLHLRFQVDDMYLRRPDFGENQSDWFWTRADHVICRTREGLRTEAAICPIIAVDTEANTTELWGGTFTATLEQPREGDIYELWVMLKLANGTSLEECTGTWIFSGGEFIPQS